MSSPILGFPLKNIICNKQLVILIVQLVGMKLAERQSEKQSQEKDHTAEKHVENTMEMFDV